MRNEPVPTDAGLLRGLAFGFAIVIPFWVGVILWWKL